LCPWEETRAHKLRHRGNRGFNLPQHFYPKPSYSTQGTLPRCCDVRVAANLRLSRQGRVGLQPQDCLNTTPVASGLAESPDPAGPNPKT
jgi:hypothetical protein